MTVTRWKLAKYGQPKPEDYPIAVERARRPYPGGHLQFWTTAMPHLDPDDRWCSVTLPTEDEPAPLPEPFKPMSTYPRQPKATMPVLDVDLEVNLRALSYDSAQHPDWLGWCTPEEWRAFWGVDA